MNSLECVLFVLVIEYLVILGALIMGFIKSVCIGETIIKSKKHLIDWIFSIVFWPIVLIIDWILERYRKE